MATISFYDQFVEYMGDGGIDMDGDTFKLELYDSSHTFTAANNARANVSANAVATGNGYTNPGQNLTTPAWTQPSGGVTQFDAVDVTWNASGGSIVADDAVLYSDTSTVPATDLLVCSIDFAGTQTAGTGTDFVVSWHTNGIFRIS